MMIDPITPPGGTYSLPAPADWLKTTAATAAVAMMVGSGWAPAHAAAPQSTARSGLLSYGGAGLGQQPAMHAAQTALDQNVQTFVQERVGADLGAIQEMHRMAVHSFATPLGLPAVEFEASSEEESGPVLFMTLNTHGMDFDEQMRRETALRETIWANERLREAKKYVVISIY